MHNTVKIAIDGPAGAGKSTIAKECAKYFSFTYIDTGAMYRAVALMVINRGLKTDDETQVYSVLDEINIDILHANGQQHIILNGDDVSESIRVPAVSLGASHVAVFRKVREKLVALQRGLADKYDVIMDGRDIGSYVLKDAQIKIFLTADVTERAKRRYDEMIEKGMPANLDDVLNDMKFRDNNDSTRSFAPLECAKDAHTFDTTGNTLEQSIELIRQYISQRLQL